MEATADLSLSGGNNDLGFVAIFFRFLLAERKYYDHRKPQVPLCLLLIYRLRTQPTYAEFAFLT